MNREQKFLTQPPIPETTPPVQRRAASLARVSTTEQLTNSSLPNQIKENRAYAERMGLSVDYEFQDDVSGTIAIRERPQAGRVYGLVERGAIDVVIINTFDRTARDEEVMEYLLFKTFLHKHNVELHYSDTGLDPYTPEGNLVGYVKAQAASNERKRIIERTRKGRRSRAVDQGLAVGPVPFVYDILRDDKGKSIGYAFNEQYRDLCDEMARLFLERRPYVDIARALGVHPNSGKRWSYATIYFFISNPFNYGIIDYGRRSKLGERRVIRKGHHQPAWPEEVCRQLQAELARRRELAKHVPHGQSLLGGILFCGYCGRPLVARAIYRSRHDPNVWMRTYGCLDWYSDRPGYSISGRNHPPNHMSERKALSTLRDLLSKLTPAKLDTYIEHFMPAPANTNRLRWLTEQLETVRIQLDEVQSELKIIKTATARAALDAERKRLAELEKNLQAETEGESAIEVFDRDFYRAEITKNLFRPDLFELPPDEFRKALQHVRLYVRNGKFVPRPDMAK